MSSWFNDDQALDNALSQLGNPPASAPMVGPEAILAKAAALAPAAVTTSVGLAGWKLVAALGVTGIIGFGGGMIVQDMNTPDPIVASAPVVEQAPEESLKETEKESPAPIESTMEVEKPEPSSEKETNQSVAPKLRKSKKSRRISKKRSGKKRKSATKAPLMPRAEKEETILAEEISKPSKLPSLPDETSDPPEESIAVTEKDNVEESSPVWYPDPAAPEAKVQEDELVANLPSEPVTDEPIWRVAAGIGFEEPLVQDKTSGLSTTVRVQRLGDAQWHSRLGIELDLSVAPYKSRWAVMPGAQMELGVGRKGKRFSPSLSLAAGARAIVVDDSDDSSSEDNDVDKKVSGPALVLGPRVQLDIDDTYWIALQHQIAPFRKKGNKEQNWFGVQVGMNFPIGGS